MKSVWKFLEQVTCRKARFIYVNLKTTIEAEDFNCSGLFVKR
jgi:hypothetical protein